MSPQMVNVKAVNLHQSWKDMVNTPHLGRTKGVEHNMLSPWIRVGLNP